MRVAFLLIAFPVPSETFILNQITGLLDRGHDVEIVARRAGEGVEHPDVAAYGLRDRAVYATALPSSRAARAAFGAREMLRAAPAARRLRATATGVRATSLDLLALARAVRGRRSYDVVHCHFGPNGVLATHLRRMDAIDGRIVTSYHGIDLTRIVAERGAAYYADLFRDGELHLPVSEFFRSVLLESGCDPARTAVHHMGVDLERFLFRPRAAPGEGVTRLLTVARLVEKKGVEYGVRAVAALVRSGRTIEYRIVGDGPLRPRLEDLIEEVGAGEAISILGWRDQSAVRRLLDGAHIVLAPSVTAADGDCEGIPVVLMEAMASGAAVVSTVHSGIPELVEDGVSGHLVPERDAESLADRLERLIADPDSWPALARAARRRVEAGFDRDALNDRLVELYRGAVDS